MEFDRNLIESSRAGAIKCVIALQFMPRRGGTRALGAGSTPSAKLPYQVAQKDCQQDKVRRNL